jgi:3-deoxy-D-manno-octulosonic-acid transferase
LGTAAEEALLAAVCPEGVQLLCAPRKPERFEEAFAALGGPQRCGRRSTGQPAEKGTTRFLLDTIGELRAAYALADVVVIGRSFGAQYGSDPIEPVALGKAVVCGPRMSDFDSSMGPLLEGRGIVQVGAGALAETLARLVASDHERCGLTERGRGVILAQRGATARHAGLIREMQSGASCG